MKYLFLAGNHTATTNANGSETTSMYNERDDSTTLTDALGISISYNTYD